mmetsp:Transcript_1211/g.5241  ORF Transcript_1211/g.5241 Transcript_1211/m.5241 type:complete len:270 (-) Transcript_1211:717-1526(-)
MRSVPDLPSIRPSLVCPRATASSGVGTRRNSRQSTLSTCSRVVQLSIMHATSSFHSSDHRISSRSPNGDLGGDHQSTGRSSRECSSLSARSSSRSDEPPPRAPPSDSSNGSGASLNGDLGSPAAAATRRCRTGVVPTKSSAAAGHSDARSKSVARSKPWPSSGLARRTPDPPCVERTAPRPRSSRLGAGATWPRALGPGARRDDGPGEPPSPATLVPGLPTISADETAPAQSKSSNVSLPSPPPPFAFAAAGPAASASTPSLASTVAPS